MSDFIIMGLIMSVILGFYFTCLVVNSVNSNIFKIIISIIISLTVGFGLSFITIKDTQKEIDKFNNGICTKCNEQLELISVYKTQYVFKCKNNHSIELSTNPYNE